MDARSLPEVIQVTLRLIDPLSQEVFEKLNNKSRWVKVFIEGKKLISPFSIQGVKMETVLVPGKVYKMPPEFKEEVLKRMEGHKIAVEGFKNMIEAAGRKLQRDYGKDVKIGAIFQEPQGAE